MRCVLALVLTVPPSVAAQPLPGRKSPEEVLAAAKQVLAPLEGELRTPGLREPVEVLRDRWGVAHIYAQSARDLFFAQGFVAAQDRLFQIDLWRRQAAGGLAEVFGPALVEADQFARLMKYRGDMDAEWTSYSPDTKAIATAFTDGVNACIDRFGDRPPVEFQLLGIKPGKWRPEDVLGRMSGIYMSGQPGGPHYGDLAPLWAKGEYFPLAYSRRQVEAVTRHRLTLKPG